jgi:hypothetical protein
MTFCRLMWCRPESTVSVTSGETSGTDSHTDTQFLMSSDRQEDPALLHSDTVLDSINVQDELNKNRMFD